MSLSNTLIEDRRNLRFSVSVSGELCVIKRWKCPDPCLLVERFRHEVVESG